MKERVVGRAEWKLSTAARAFGFDFAGKKVLDIGSSTGGFTEYALRRGAAQVVAVEKGTKQMKAPLRFDPRVKLSEKTDFLQVAGVDAAGELVVQEGLTVNKAADLAVEQGGKAGQLVTPLQVARKAASAQVAPLSVDVVLADVSFVSLREILAHAQRVVAPRAEYLVMLKPQFEAFPDQLVQGVVKNERMRREIIKSFEQWLGRNGFLVVKKRDNNEELRGKRGGNLERFYWLRAAGYSR